MLTRIFSPQADRTLMLVIVTGKIPEYDGWRDEKQSLHPPSCPSPHPQKKPLKDEARDRRDEYTHTSPHSLEFSILMQHSGHMSRPGDRIHHSSDAAVYYLIDRSVLSSGELISPQLLCILLSPRRPAIHRQRGIIWGRLFARP